MNHAVLLSLGLFLAMASSWCGLVLAPQLQLGALQPAKQEAPAQPYPAPRPGEAQQGREVYRALGCVHCHTQQVRPEGFGNDYDRGWGRRRTVARDYLEEQPLMLGSLRLGPDLANIGARNPRHFAIPWQFRSTNQAAQSREMAAWHLQHLYHPAARSPGSLMPPHPMLFTHHKIGRAPAPDALKLPAPFALEQGHEIVPKPEALQLVAYLLSLRAEAPLYEAPFPAPPTNPVVRPSLAPPAAIPAPVAPVPTATP